MAGSEREKRFRALYDLTRPLIIGYALRRARSPEDAADVVAETFAIAWRRFDSVPVGEAAVPWLYVTARNVLANLGRRTDRSHGVVARLGDEFRGAFPESVGPQDESALVAKRALARLTDSEKEIIMLVGWEGFSDQDLGELLDCSPAAARIRLHRARSRLIEALAKEESAEKQGAADGHPTSKGSDDSGPRVGEEQPW